MIIAGSLWSKVCVKKRMTEYGIPQICKWHQWGKVSRYFLRVDRDFDSRVRIAISILSHYRYTPGWMMSSNGVLFFSVADCWMFGTERGEKVLWSPVHRHQRPNQMVQTPQEGNASLLHKLLALYHLLKRYLWKNVIKSVSSQYQFSIESVSSQ